MKDSKQHREKPRDEPMFQKLTAAIENLAHAIREASSNDKQTRAILDRLAQMETKIMQTQTELANDLKAVLAQQQKTATEISAVQAGVDTLKQQVADLQAVIDSGGTISQELIDAVAAVKAQAQVIDDLIPDSPTPPTT